MVCGTDLRIVSDGECRAEGSMDAVFELYVSWSARRGVGGDGCGGDGGSQDPDSLRRI
jgi:hypothetical protein